MPWTSVTAVVGDPTRASQLNNVQGNASWLQTLADVDHDFNTSTGTGRHKSIVPTADSTYDLGSATYRFQILYVDKIGDQGQTLILDTLGTRWETTTLAHGMTGLLATDQYASIAASSTSDGGLVLYGVSGVATLHGLQLTGIIGNADPTDTVAAVRVYGGKKNGTTWQALGADETAFQLTNYTTNVLTILGAGTTFINDISNANATSGLTVNQLTQTGECLALKQSSVLHGMTVLTETDTYATLKQYTANSGGLLISGYSDDDYPGLGLHGVIGTNNPTDTVPAVTIAGSKKDGAGTSRAVLGDAETVLQINNLTTTYATMLGSGAWGLGIATPDGRLHVWTASAGTVTAAAFADELVLENSDNAGVTILTPNNKAAYLAFGDADDNDVGYIAYDHSVNVLNLATATGVRMAVGDAGQIYIGGSYVANTNMTIGLTIQQGTASNTAIALKGSYMAHGMTLIAETDTYAKVSPLSGTYGGLLIYGLTDALEGASNGPAVNIIGVTGATNPTDATPVVKLQAAKSNGSTSWAALGVAETAFQFLNTTTALATILGSGTFTIVGTYLAPFWFGDKCMWNDGTGNFRTKMTTAPSAADDGNLLVEG